MIQIISGIYGLKKGKMVVPVTEKDGPIKLDAQREEELVNAGIAKYVNTEEEIEAEEELKDKKVDELKSIADEMGIEYPERVKKSDLIALIEEEEKIETEEMAPEIDPAEAVQ